MPTLLQSYKGAERIVYKRFTAHVARFFARLSSGWKRFFAAGRQSVSILVVAHTEAPPKGIRISLFGFAGACAAAASLLLLVFAFSGSVGSARAKVSASSEELAQAQGELEALRTETALLSAAYKDFQEALEPIMAAGGGHGQSQAAKRLSVSSLFAKKSTEIQSIAEVRESFDLSAPIVAEYGSMLGNIDSVKDTVPAIWPIGGNVGHISTIFGTTANPFTGQSYFHTGIDCSNYRSGDPIVATGDGRVVFSGSSGNYGLCIIIAHAHGYMTRYGHMNRLLVRSGQMVKQGQTIGILGNTGVSTAPHVHYEVIIGRNYLEPRDYLWAGARSHQLITGE